MRHLFALLAVVPFASALVLPMPAVADGGSYERGEAPGRMAAPPPRRGVIEVVPRLDHHYRDDMVEPGWRMYGSETYGYSAGNQGFDPAYGSLDRQSGSYGVGDGCQPWRNRCRPAEPWWTR